MRWAVAGAALLGSACESSLGESTGSYDGSDGLADGWNTNPNESPTGTTLLPTAPNVSVRDGIVTSPAGYEVVDELCGAFAIREDQPDRGKVFETPMFRAFAVRGDRAWAVDGSRLFEFSLTDPTSPRLVSIPDGATGTPIALAVSDDALWVATVDGLIRHTFAADGSLDAGATIPLTGDVPVLDVAVAGESVVLARGSAGLTRLSPDGDGWTQVDSPGIGLANALTVGGDIVAVAACLEVRIHALDDALSLVQRIPIPYGQAKSVALDGDRLYVGVGLAMLAIRIGDTPALIGHYADPVAGFYVNDILHRDGVVYIAAGDESVRAVRIDASTIAPGVPITWDEPDPEVDSPIALPTPILAVQDYVVPRDPLALTLEGNLLYALGNFRYRGRRTIEVFDVTQPGYLEPVGQWEEPVRVGSTDALGDGTLISGETGAWLVTGEAATAVEPSTREPIAASAARGAVGVLASRRGGLLLLGDSDPVPSPFGNADLAAGALAMDDERLYAASIDEDAILVARRDPPGLVGALSLEDSFFGEAALAVAGDRLLAYDRITGLLTTFLVTNEPLPLRVGLTWIGPCEAYDYASTFDGSRAARAQFAVLGERAFLSCPRPEGVGDASLPRLYELDPEIPAIVRTLGMPEGALTHLAVSDSALAALYFSPGRLESTLVVRPLGDASSDALKATFVGHGAGIATFGDGWVVGDAFWGTLRRFGADVKAISSRELAP
jgi:hypothetical protein